MADAPAPLVARAVELLATAERATTAYGREDLTGRVAAGPRPPRPARPARARRRRVQAGQEHAGQRAAQRPAVPRLRRVGDGRADDRPPRRRGAAPRCVVDAPTGADGTADDGRRAITLDEIPDVGIRARQRRQRSIDPRRRDPGAAPAAGLRPGPGRHAGGRWAALGARGGHDGGARHGRGRRLRQRRLPGAVGGRDRGAARRRGPVLDGGVRADEDRPLPGVAAHRRARSPAPGGRRARPRATCCRCRRCCARRRWRRSSKAVNEESGYPALLRFLNESVIAAGPAGRRAHGRRARCCSPSTRWRRRSPPNAAVLVDPDRAQPRRRRPRAGPGREPSGCAPSRRGGSRRSATARRTWPARSTTTCATGSASSTATPTRHSTPTTPSTSGTTSPAGSGSRRQPTWRRTPSGCAIEADALAARVAEHFAIDETAVVHAVDVGQRADDHRRHRARSSRRAPKGVGRPGGDARVLRRDPHVRHDGPARRADARQPADRSDRHRAGSPGAEGRAQAPARRCAASSPSRRRSATWTRSPSPPTRRRADSIRFVQRELRDEFTARAEQLQRSTRESLTAAEAAARQTAAQAERADQGHRCRAGSAGRRAPVGRSTGGGQRHGALMSPRS